MMNRRRVIANITGVLFLAFIASLCGCQAMSPRAPTPTPTPILLPPQTATVQPIASPGATEAFPTELAATVTAQAAPLVVPEMTPTGAAQGGIMALGRRATTILRAQAASNAEVIAQVPGSHVLRAQGRTRDGSWLWVAYNDAGQQAWVAAGDVKLMGDVLSLAEIAPVSAAVPTPRAAPMATAAPLPLRGKIVFQTATGSDIYLVNADGTGLRRLTDGIDPALSPDGTRVAFARWGAPHGVFVLDLRTGEERRVASGDRPRSPAWNPAGTQIAFVHVIGSDICLSTPLGCMDEETLRARFGGQDCLDTPFGRFCIQDFSTRSIDRTGIALIGADAQGWSDIAAATDAQAIAWRPGNDELLYRGAGGLQTTGQDHSPQTLTENTALGSPAWSPDGTRIAVQEYLHDHSDLFLLDAAGNRVTRLTAPTSTSGRAPNNVAPTWSPDGKFLLFLSDRDGAWRLYRMNADGSGQTLFLPATLKDLHFSYDFAAERVASWGR